MKTEIQVIEQNEIALAYQKNTVKELFSNIAEQAKSVVFNLENPKEQKELKSLVYKIRQSKTAFDNFGKELKEQYTVVTKKIDEDRKFFRDSSDQLISELLEPLVKIEMAENKRVQDIQDRISKINAYVLLSFSGSAQIQEYIDELKSLEIDESFQEYQSQAKIAKYETIESLEKIKIQREQMEEQAKQERERQQKERERQQLEHDERIKREAIEQAEAQAKLREDKLKRQAEQERHRADLAKQEAELATQKERERIEAEKLAQQKAEAKRQANKKHRDKILIESAESLQSIGINPDDAKKIVVAIFKGEIKNININF